MAGELNGLTVAVLATDGVEQVELDRPWQALEEAGAQPELVSLEAGEITAYQHIDKGDTKKVDAVVSSADPDEYDALVLPGGVINGDFIRADADAVAFVKAFFEAGKPGAAICHAPRVPAGADVVRGRRMTSWASLQNDLRNAGAAGVDEEVVVGGNLLTRRNPRPPGPSRETAVPTAGPGGLRGGVGGADTPPPTRTPDARPASPPAIAEQLAAANQPGDEDED